MPTAPVQVHDHRAQGLPARAARLEVIRGAAREIELRLHLGGTGPWAEVRASDLTPEYVRLNSEYTT